MSFEENAQSIDTFTCGTVPDTPKLGDLKTTAGSPCEFYAHSEGLSVHGQERKHEDVGFAQLLEIGVPHFLSFLEAQDSIPPLGMDTLSVSSELRKKKRGYAGRQRRSHGYSAETDRAQPQNPLTSPELRKQAKRLHDHWSSPRIVAPSSFTKLLPPLTLS